MQNAEINRQIQRLDDIFRRTNIAVGSDVEMRAHWARYLSILCAGLLENAIKEIYKSHCRVRANPTVANYATESLSRISNPKARKFIDVANSFNPVWGDELKLFLSDNGRQEAIDSIMNHRNNIAHGKDTSISIVTLKEYYVRAVEVLEYIETQCK